MATSVIPKVATDASFRPPLRPACAKAEFVQFRQSRHPVMTFCAMTEA